MKNSITGPKIVFRCSPIHNLLPCLLLPRVLLELLDTDHLESPRLRKRLAVIPSRHRAFLVIWLDELA